MRIVEFPGCNTWLNKPEDMTDEQCEGVPAFRSKDEDGYPFTLVALQPNYEDQKAIAAGRPIMLKILGNAFPPIATFTMDENDQPNF
jgi:hypothetical protein